MGFFVVKRVSAILLLILCLVNHICGLNVGRPLSNADHNATISFSTPCSRTCESDHCTLPPLLRYGKYCGLLYSGCPGEKPCDELDECCMVHDNCVQSNHNDYLNVQCNQNFLDCIIAFRDSGRPSFGGSRCVVVEVVDVISVVIEAAIIAGKIHH